MAVHTIEHLQTITLMGIFLNTRDRADAAWSLLGAAIKVCTSDANLDVREAVDNSRFSRWAREWDYQGWGRSQISSLEKSLPCGKRHGKV